MMNSARLAFKHDIILLLFSSGEGRGRGMLPDPPQYQNISIIPLYFFSGENSAIVDISAQFAVNVNNDSGYICVIITGTPFMALVQVVECG